MLEHKKRYLQIAFNYDLSLVYSLMPKIPFSDRILIEAGTPFIKNEGSRGISVISFLWPDTVVADIKIVDGAGNEVVNAHNSGANAITAAGNAPTETLDIFIQKCQELELISMIDMVGVQDPLRVLMKLKTPPDVVTLHRGRDEEQTQGKNIEYRHIRRIKSKFDVIISAAGGVDLKEARSAVFNGADIVVVNLVKPGDPWVGIPTTADISELSNQFLNTIK